MPRHPPSRHPFLLRLFLSPRPSHDSGMPKSTSCSTIEIGAENVKTPIAERKIRRRLNQLRKSAFSGHQSHLSPEPFSPRQMFVEVKNISQQRPFDELQQSHAKVTSRPRGRHVDNRSHAIKIAECNNTWPYPAKTIGRTNFTRSLSRRNSINPPQSHAMPAASRTSICHMRFMSHSGILTVSLLRQR